ncbi:MAG: peptidase S41 [Chloroflexi bacterium]|nr:peptidase S41 [Chloroflexota bacterium]
MTQSHRTIRGVALISLLAILACALPGADLLTSDDEQADEAGPTAVPPTLAPVAGAPVTGAGEPVRVTGMIEVSNELIIEVYYFERFVYLQDMTGFINRDFEYDQPLDAQILGPVRVTDGTFSYVLNLPAVPASPLNDVDNDGETDSGVQVWQIVMDSNLLDDPFLSEDETGGWSANYNSAFIDRENENEVAGGELLLWAPDDAQSFPSGFGPDGLLFTDDDPVTEIEAGYSLVDLDADPFSFTKQETLEVNLSEGDIAVNDLSDLTWTEGFDALFEQVSREYPFTELKGLDWQALYDEIAPRIAEAESRNDGRAYYLALQDFAFAIPDGHVGLNGETFGAVFDDAGGGVGLGLLDLEDGRTIAHVVVDGLPAAEAGIEWGAEIVSWNGGALDDAIAQDVNWIGPFSNPTVERLEDLRFLIRLPIGESVEIEYINPGASEPSTAQLQAVQEVETFFHPHIGAFDLSDESQEFLPVEFDILPSGHGYVAIYTFSDELNLTLRLWERAIETFIEQDVRGVIVDMRDNGGGAPIGPTIASYFVDERIDLYRSYYYSDTTGDLETFGPPAYTEPDDDLNYDGPVAVLIGPACASACENVSYVLGLLEQSEVIGFYSTNGIYGEVARGQYDLPGGYSFQIPTGLTRDLDGNIIIEGPGVVPDLRVPMSLEAAERLYLAGEDVLLGAAIDALP